MYVGASSNFAFKIAAKPLQIETWLLLTAYIEIMKSHRPVQRYRCRLLTTYRLATIHALQTTDDRQTTTAGQNASWLKGDDDWRSLTRHWRQTPTTNNTRTPWLHCDVTSYGLGHDDDDADNGNRWLTSCCHCRCNRHRRISLTLGMSRPPCRQLCTLAATTLKISPQLLTANVQINVIL